MSCMIYWRVYTLQHVLQLLLTYCIDEKHYFSIKYLNEKIQGMEFGYMEDTCPAPVENTKHLRQKGMIIVPWACYSSFLQLHNHGYLGTFYQ